MEQFKSFKHTKYDMLFLNLDNYEKQEIHIINSFLVSNSELKNGIMPAFTEEFGFFGVR